MVKSLVPSRALLLLVFIQTIRVAALTRQYDVSTPPLGLGGLLTEGSSATIFRLDERNVNGTRFLLERQRRSILDGEAQMLLYDDLLSKGYYTSSILIGTPARTFRLIVDTGSTVTYVPCSTCTHCGTHQDAAFKPADSSSYEAIACTSPACNTGVCGDNHQCKYERQYAESSTSAGVLGKDLFEFAEHTGLGSPKLMFGCENDETGDLFYQKADGIMGLGRGPLSIVDQLVKEKDMADTFSLCYGGMDEQGGSMIMGDFAHPPGMLFTASDPKRSPYYNIVLKQIKVAGTVLPVDPSVFDARFGTVLDSGTTYAYLPEKAYIEFKRAVLSQLTLNAVSGPDPQFEDVCFQGAGTDPKKLSQHFPAVDLVFGDGVSLPLEPENYLFKHTKIPGAYCLGVFKNGNDHTTLLGGILVRNVLVKYDRANKRIGFWRTKCTDLWNSLDDAFGTKAVSAPTPSPVSAPTPSPTTVFPSPPLEVPTAVPAPGISVERVNITVEHIAGLELNMSIFANYTTFSSLSSAYVEDMARDLELELHQVELLQYQKSGPGVDVIFSVSSASSETLPGVTVQQIIGRLQQHQVRFRNDLGSYRLNNWRVIPEESSWKKVGLIVGIVILTAALAGGVGLWFYLLRRDATHNVKYVAVDPLARNDLQQL